MSEPKQQVVVYPGSFDPFTLGHLDILERVLGLFPRVVVLVADQGKAGLLTSEQRAELITVAVRDLAGVQVKIFSGLLVNTVAQMGASAVVRGIRCASDYEHEWSLSGVNALLASQMEFIYFLARPELAPISSSLVRDVLKHGGSLDKLVPLEISRKLETLYPRG